MAILLNTKQFSELETNYNSPSSQQAAILWVVNKNHDLGVGGTLEVSNSWTSCQMWHLIGWEYKINGFCPRRMRICLLILTVIWASNTNAWQHILSGWPSACKMWCTEWYNALKCCDCLVGALCLRPTRHKVTEMCSLHTVYSMPKAKQ